MSEPRLPYGRTHTCGDLRETDAGKKVTLTGFVGRKLDDTTFTLDDGAGRTLVVISPDASDAARAAATFLKDGVFVSIAGDVQKRMRASTAIPTGAIYLRPSKIDVLSYAEGAPEEGVSDQSPWDERLRYRQLELRTGPTRERLIQRARFLATLRGTLAERDFTEVETPHLGPWSTEATDSFLCPVAPDTTYALPGSPQPYKQLLMVGGVDRYFQIARCFRNEEELSPAHQLEYSALDLEMAYGDDQDLFPTVEAALATAFAAIGVELKTPFPRLTYHEAMLRYGTDAPDLRFELHLVALNKELGPKLADGRHARGLCAKGGAKVSDAALEALRDELTAGEFGVFEMVWARLGPDGKPAGSASELLNDAVSKALGTGAGALAVIVTADHANGAAVIAGRVRTLLGKELFLAKPGTHAIAWLERFPFSQFDPHCEEYNIIRHAFTQPVPAHASWVSDPERKLQVLSRGFDLVLDGQEVGAGSVRNHDLELQREIFAMFEQDPEDVERRFGRIWSE